MKLNTMAAVMTFVSKIESDSSLFYQENAERFPELQDHFQSWAKENKKFEKRVKQTYFGVITDTLESNFAFEGLDTDDYALELTLTANADLHQAKKSALGIEENIEQFYLKAAKLSDGLMADIPRLFNKIAKVREERRRVISGQ